MAAHFAGAGSSACEVACPGFPGFHSANLNQLSQSREPVRSVAKIDFGKMSQACSGLIKLRKNRRTHETRKEK